MTTYTLDATKETGSGTDQLSATLDSYEAMQCLKKSLWTQGGWKVDIVGPCPVCGCRLHFDTGACGVPRDPYLGNDALLEVRDSLIEGRPTAKWACGFLAHFYDKYRPVRPSPFTT